jgi:hypothetical protein
MMCGDDMVFETKGWDKDILSEFDNLPPDKMRLVHCNDGMRGPGNPFPTHAPFAVAPFIHRRYYDVLGYYVREEWRHGFHDTWLDEVYGIMGRKVYRHDIMIRHLHISNPTSGTKPDAISDRLCKAYTSINNPQGLFNSMRLIREAEARMLLCR